MKKIFLLLLIPLLIGGCSSYKKSIYLRNDEVLEKAQQNNKQYVYRVMPKDELTITVSTSDPASSVPFYRKIGQGKDQASSAQGMNNAKLLDYLVGVTALVAKHLIISPKMGFFFSAKPLKMGEIWCILVGLGAKISKFSANF